MSTSALFPVDAIPGRLSESVIWTLQRSFYTQLSQQAWTRDIVPSYITSNAYIAQTYASYVFAHLEGLGLLTDDATAAATPSDRNSTDDSNTDSKTDSKTAPVQLYLYELGSGSGKFGFLFLQELRRLLTVAQRTGKFVYVFTDFCEENVVALQQHPQLAALPEADFAQVDSGSGADWGQKLLKSGRPLNPDAHLVLIGNYFFDTLRQDCFMTLDGKLYEVTMQAFSEHKEDSLDLEDYTLIERLQCQWALGQPVDVDTYYEHNKDASLTSILRSSQEVAVQRQATDSDEANTVELPTYFTVPVGGLRVLARLRKYVQGSTLLLVGDKGDVHGASMHTPPVLAPHGSFSLPVSFQSLASYTRHLGGTAWLPRRVDEDHFFNTCLFLFPDCKQQQAQQPPTRFHRRMLSLVFDDKGESFNVNDFFQLQRECQLQNASQHHRFSLPHLHRLLRLGRFDPDLFCKFKEGFINALVATLSPTLHRNVLVILDRVEQQYFRLDHDLYFDLARAHSQLGRFQTALRYFLLSRELYGEHYITDYHIAECHFKLDQVELALPLFRTLLDEEPEYAYTSSLFAQLENLL
jgi:tetratricopeptide (TPR) repeat protein